MMPRTVAPHGSWTSPITAERLVERAIGVQDVTTHGGRIAWCESRPNEEGRYVVVAAGPDGEPVELTPPGFSTRTQVHEYGGRCWTFDGADLIASNWEDQRLWRFAPGAEPEPLTAEPTEPRSVRFADPVVTPDRRWVICVREGHLGDRVDNDLVAVPLRAPGEPVVLASGHDFYAAPAVSPDGSRLAWLSWDHPEMPWDATECWVAVLRPDGSTADPQLVAGREGESVQQPRWSPDGVLHWVSDRTGWWNLYRQAEGSGTPAAQEAEGSGTPAAQQAEGSGTPAAGVPLCPMEAEFGVPSWVFGLHTYDFLADGTVVATWHGPDGGGIGVVTGGGVLPFATPYRGFEYLAGDGGAVAAVASSPTEPPAVVRITPDGTTRVVRRTRDAGVAPGSVSVAEHIRFPTAGGEEAWAWFYRPANADFEGPAGERPPLVVKTHGGPTSAADPSFNLGVQYWTSRGFAVADVDYRGSTGYGRAYRNRLRDNWGVCDVEDVVAVTRWLAEHGEVDADRCVIRGGSAGGYTTLAALAFTDAFAAGASYYGVADLGALARDTHKFESHYTDRLVGPWPEAEATYRARSALFNLEGFDRPLILLQGLEDRVVPPAQSEAIFEAVRGKGVPVAYLPFPGEQHGFRRADTIVAATRAELSFYGLVLGFTPDGAVELAVENAGALPRR